MIDRKENPRAAGAGGGGCLIGQLLRWVEFCIMSPELMGGVCVGSPVPGRKRGLFLAAKHLKDEVLKEEKNVPPALSCCRWFASQSSDHKRTGGLTRIPV